MKLLRDFSWRAIAIFQLVAPAAFAADLSENLLLNPSFEYETAADFHGGVYWTLNHPDVHGDAYGSARRENWRAQDGFYAMAIRGTWANAGDAGGAWQEIPVFPGTTYRFSAWIWADAVWTAATCEIKIEFWNDDRSQRLATVRRPLTDVGESWREETLEAVAPDEAAWVRAVVHVSGAGPEGALLIDSLALRTEDKP